MRSHYSYSEYLHSTAPGSLNITALLDVHSSEVLWYSPEVVLYDWLLEGEELLMAGHDWTHFGEELMMPPNNPDTN